MSEHNEVIGEIPNGDEAIVVTRDNLSLYRHLGINAIYDHCYIHRTDGDDVYIWSFNPLFEEYAQLAEEKRSFMALNKKEPSDNDRKWYMLHSTEDLNRADDIAKRWVDDQAEL